jgi:hypothetical protein
VYKRVVQQQVPLPLPCVNFAQITASAIGSPVRLRGPG